MPIFSGNNFSAAASYIQYSRVRGDTRTISCPIIIQYRLNKTTDKLHLYTCLTLDSLQKILAIARLARRFSCYSENLFGLMLFSKFLVLTHRIQGSLEFITGNLSFFIHAFPKTRHRRLVLNNLQLIRQTTRHQDLNSIASNIDRSTYGRCWLLHKLLLKVKQDYIT